MQIFQKRYLDYIEFVKSAITRFHASGAGLQLDDGPLTALAANIQSKELLIPVVGAFSAGKSSLLNAIMGAPVLSVGIAPETATPTELRYGSEQRAEAVFSNGDMQNFSVQDLPALQARAEELDCVRLYLDLSALKALEPLVLVDMPGFNSPLDAHKKAIDRYIGEGAHYLFVISVEEGTIQTSALQEMLNITTMGRSFSVCVNKSDLRTPQDVASICADVQESLAAEGLPAKVCSVSQNDVSAVQEILKIISPNELYAHIFLPLLRLEHKKLNFDLQTASDSLQQKKEENEKTLQELQSNLEDLEQAAAEEYGAADFSLDSRVNEILQIIKNRLNYAVDGMAQSFMRGGKDAVTRIVTDEVRSGLLEGARQVTDSMSAQLVCDFSARASQNLPLDFQLSKDWTDDLLQAVQTNLLPSLFSILGSPANKGSVAGGAAGLMLMGKIGHFMPHPLLKIAVPVVTTLLGGLWGRVSEGQQLEKIKDALRTQVFPEVERALRPQISDFVMHAQEQAAQTIKSAFEKQIQSQKSMIEKAIADSSLDDKKAALDAIQSLQDELKKLSSSYL